MTIPAPAVKLAWMPGKSPPPIGDRLAQPYWLLALGLSAALTVVIFDLFVHGPRDEVRRAAFAAAGVALMYGLVRGDRHSLGLRLHPHRGWWWWIKLSLLIGVAMGLVVTLSVGVLWLFGSEPEMVSMFTADDQFRGVAWHAIVIAPLLEEPIYRLLLCVPVVAALGRWPAVVVSGGVFGYLHFRYGNPSPDNFFAGYALAWAYLESRSLLVPVLLHAAGNLLVVIGNIAVFYYLQP